MVVDFVGFAVHVADHQHNQKGTRERAIEVTEEVSAICYGVSIRRTVRAGSAKSLPKRQVGRAPLNTM